MPAQKKTVVTAARIEKWLDMVAEFMERAGKRKELYLPIWRALERELAARQEAEALIAAASARLRRSKDRTAERSA